MLTLMCCLSILGTAVYLNWRYLNKEANDVPTTRNQSGQT
jgi:predicted negative regulator of RcsB-dependent stress response